MVDLLDSDYALLKENIKNTKFKMLLLRMEIVKLGLLSLGKSWLLEDPVFCERYSKLIDMENNSVKDIVDYETFIFLLEESEQFFLLNDLKDGFEFISENIEFEINYYNYLKEFLRLLDDYGIQGDAIISFMEDNEANSCICYDQIKINRKNLKKIEKEWRDIFE